MLPGESTPLNNPGTNHPLAPRMAVISFIAYNLAIACIFGIYSLLVGPIETKLGVTRELSSLGLPLIYLSLSVMAPVAGILAGKYSIRLLMMVGALLMAAGFAVAATTGSIYVFLAAYGLLIGPGNCLAATILPPILITRWYNVNRGRALGLVNMPILGIAAPPLTALALRGYGLSGTYFMLAGLMVLLLLALFFIVDYPPSTIDPTGEDVAAEAASNPGMSVGELLRTSRYWTLSLAYATIMASVAVQAAHLVPMATDWGIDVTRASGLVSASATGGMIGSVIFGWIADRIGGARALTILCFDTAILWAIMMLQPPYAVALVASILLGVHGAAIVAVFSLALSERFGQATFGRAYGMSFLLSLPFMVLAAPVVAHMYVLSGSYRSGLIGLAALLLAGAVAAIMGRRTRPVPATA